MIDSHCHLEQKDYDRDRDNVIERAKAAGLKAIITCCARPQDFELTMDIVKRHKDFVFATVGIHPEYIKDFSDEEIDQFINIIKQNAANIVGIGETGLDKFWIKEREWLEKQEELFVRLIELAKRLKKPLLIHSRKSEEDCVKILENEDATNVLMHMFGANHLTKRVIENGWHISVNTIVLRSKKHNKVVRDCPIERLLLETDAPWLAPQTLGSAHKARNEPTSIKLVAEKVAEIKGLPFETVWSTCGSNSIAFFKLPFI
ncbi:MAG: TatD family hydrolase [Candidatus Aenigmatarchaeota archaeon]